MLLLHGPNLNLLGERDPAQYGRTTLADIEARVTELGAELGVDVACHQSNHEGVLVDHVHAARRLHQGIVLNPGAHAHYSIALRDAIEAVSIPCVEIHISNVHAREPFRHTSVTAPVTRGYISGCGVFGYDLALRAVLHRMAEGAEGAQD
ncbi:type II 3-dehydroquinate dehydratase [Spinactinospora alkalitolerans]|uniref:type II 3-dehydroquinate dehydratase n=1 Tax=Spinactinospora alkalitolerans TaxID=687207 RepID=UPI0028ADFD37|nr:type II 3-dehydroquinate dehydratase [Spinactinospora alkalitolerans]